MIKIICFSSGGIDSIFALFKLIKIGYNPIVYYIQCCNININNTCLSFLEQFSLKILSYKIKFKYKILNLSINYYKNIFSYLIINLKFGYIINPDLFCNKLIKFNYLLYTSVYNCYFCYGHYVRLDNNYNLQFALDKIKDQSFFLSFLLKKKIVKFSIFPLGMHIKKYVVYIICFFILRLSNLLSTNGLCFFGNLSFNKIISTLIKSFSLVKFKNYFSFKSNLYSKSLGSKLPISGYCYLYKKYLYNIFLCLKDSNLLKIRLIFSKSFLIIDYLNKFFYVKINSCSKMYLSLVIFEFNRVKVLFFYPIRIISIKQIIVLYNFYGVCVGYISCDLIIF